MDVHSGQIIYRAFPQLISRSFRSDDQYDLYDLGHAVWWEPYNLHGHMFPGSNLYLTDTAQHLVTPGSELL